jgi:predicted transglutaminase-like protease
VIYKDLTNMDIEIRVRCDISQEELLRIIKEKIQEEFNKEHETGVSSSRKRITVTNECESDLAS